LIPEICVYHAWLTPFPEIPENAVPFVTGNFRKLKPGFLESDLGFESKSPPDFQTFLPGNFEFHSILWSSHGPELTVVWFAFWKFRSLLIYRKL